MRNKLRAIWAKLRPFAKVAKVVWQNRKAELALIGVIADAVSRAFGH